MAERPRRAVIATSVGQIAIVVVVVTFSVGAVAASWFAGSHVAARNSVRGVASTRVDSLNSTAVVSLPVFASDGTVLELRHVLPDARSTIILFRPSCDQCQAEAEIWQTLFGEGYEIVGLVDQSPELTIAIREAWSITFPLYSIDAIARRTLNARATPTIFEVNPDGVVTFAAQGPASTQRYLEHLGLGEGSGVRE